MGSICYSIVPLFYHLIIWKKLLCSVMLGKIQKNYAANHPNWYLYLDLQYLQEASYGGSQTRRCQMLRKD